ncbi:15712_t:CDS:2, partial [Entrophospora sp. SA101]
GMSDVTLELMEFRNSCNADRFQLKETDISEILKVQVFYNEHDLVLEFFESIHNSLSANMDKNIKEDAFVHKTLDSEKEVDPSLKGRIPDFSVGYSYKNRKVDLLVMEVKPPSKDSSDLVKLGNELKDIIDKSAENGICYNDLCLGGLLVEGSLSYETCREIFFAHNYYNLDTAPTTIELTMQSKLIFTQSAKITHKKLSDKDEDSFILRMNMTRQSFHTPMKIPNNVQEINLQRVLKYNTTNND